MYTPPNGILSMSIKTDRQATVTVSYTIWKKWKIFPFLVNKLSAPCDNDLEASPKHLGSRRGSCVNLTLINSAASSTSASNVTNTKTKSAETSIDSWVCSWLFTTCTSSMFNYRESHFLIHFMNVCTSILDWRRKSKLIELLFWWDT